MVLRTCIHAKEDKNEGKERKLFMKSKSRLYYIIGIMSLILLLLVVGLYIASAAKNKSKLTSHELKQKAVAEQNKKLEEEYNQKLEQWRKENIVENEDTKLPTAAKESGWDVVDMSDFPVNKGTSVTVTRQDALTGGLLVVNRWHELPADFSNVEGYIKSVGAETRYKVPVKDKNVRLFPNAIQAVQKMFEDAKKEGLESYIIRSGYRTMEAQTNSWKKVADSFKNMTGDTLTEAVRKKVSYPGTSDYQSGFSFELDIYSKEDAVINNTKFQDSDQARFVNENSWKYGIVFRFPASGYPTAETRDRDFITGINNTTLKMNAYRYVGVAHATAMHILDLCLEEYIDYLSQHPHIMIYKDGKLMYEIGRQAESEESQTIDLPQNTTSYTVSSDNVGGLIWAASFE